MCGIVGIVASEGTVDPRVLQRMNDLLAHRGPDGEGFMLGSGDWEDLRHSFHSRADNVSYDLPIRVGLGHRRLAIIDLSDRGLQPMCTRDKMTWVIFNGEIYNFQELRTELVSRGYLFSTRTDTEVLLNAYVEWGEHCVARLDGMFAFAVWDQRNRRLFCARDRLGIKPFYYAVRNGNFVFASEVKALFACSDCPRETNDVGVIDFLVHGNCDYATRTLFRDIHALPAAHTITVEPAGKFATHRYWELQVETGREDNEHQYIREVGEALRNSVRHHLISDVRAGSCLSGGLDSSTVVALIGKIRQDEPEAAAAIGDQFHTFTSCYEMKRFDERQFALAVAHSVGATPHLVFPTPEDFWSDFSRMAWHQDMPFGMLNFYAQWRVMRSASETGVKVLIDGQGGDEVFGGYAKFRYAHLLSLLQSHHFGTLTRELGGLLRNADRYALNLRNGYRYLPAGLRRALRVDSVLQRALRADWHTAVCSEATPATRWWRNARERNKSGMTLVQQIQLDDITIDTLPQLLRMEDRSSMAFSIEARVPLLDHKLVSLGVSLPDHIKIRNGWSKYAVRAAMRGVLPDVVRLRRTKLGFAAPNRQWLSEDLRPVIADLLDGELRCAKYLNVATLRHWYRSADSRTANTESLVGLFRVLSLEMWMRAFALS